MCRIFISHNSKDNADVREFIKLLVLGMNIPKEEIFSISLCENLTTGKMFPEKIKQAMLSAEKIICFITPNYVKSRFCMAELGAAWIQEQKILPILFSPLNYDDMNDTPLLGTQMRYGDKKQDLIIMHDELISNGIIKTVNTGEFNHYLDMYINSLEKTSLIQKDNDGFYTATIEDVRKVPQKFKCYKIQGLLKLDETLLPKETHWVFYRTGMYEELKIGDTIRFKVSKTEIRQFSDLPNARNVYPDVLEVV